MKKDEGKSSVGARLALASPRNVFFTRTTVRTGPSSITATDFAFSTSHFCRVRSISQASHCFGLSSKSWSLTARSPFATHSRPLGLWTSDVMSPLARIDGDLQVAFSSGQGFVDSVRPGPFVCLIL